MTTGDDTPKRIGRPPLLNKELTKRVADIVRGGNYIETAAATVGISRSTLHLWLRDGARIRRSLEALDDKAYDLAVDLLTDHELSVAEFSDTVEKAAAESETIDVLTVRAAAKDHWQAAMTRLERRHPKRWGRREAVEVSGQLDGVQVQTDNPTTAVDASKALHDERGRQMAADLIEHLAGTEPTTNNDDDDGDDDEREETSTPDE